MLDPSSSPNITELYYIPSPIKNSRKGKLAAAGVLLLSVIGVATVLTQYQSISEEQEHAMSAFEMDMGTNTMRAYMEFIA